ncbi:six-hairpin glycosidase-like protein [Flagellimonas nanhaiensis]|uniref:Six-hairpin glycosidase-like protein n=1 Tax=Flagellimonas nanhaiensis TaxID=2292706 RepID=A0A371JL15_9FLAO|nr:six-hairpin glycosidase-like protein [Allomuricauda nanhaiensis]RDY57650.1 six-hairpin glycosidase-like protein [Allomuricauda nanhaiensis]
MRISFFFVFIILSPLLHSQEDIETYWSITNRKSIVWDVAQENRLPHSDNIEMSGKNVAAIIYYDIDEEGNLTLNRDVIFPQLRTYNKSNEPDWKKYRAYFRKTIGDEVAPSIRLENKIIVPSKIDSVEIGGMLIFYATPVDGLAVTRTLLPSMEERFLVENWSIQNVGENQKNFTISNGQLSQEELGYKGAYAFTAFSRANSEVSLAPGETYKFPVFYGATLNDENAADFDADLAWKQRSEFLDTMYKNLSLKTPDEVINTLFYFSKIRAAESIYNSSMGLVHSPGGGNYYVGIWANDQVEYSGPFFPYLGYGVGNEAAFNTYKKFLENIPSDGSHIPYAFEVDGNFPMSHLDRGDAAMIAYGTSHYVLSSGDLEMATKLWPLITWSLEYCHNHRNDQGAVISESDEMEGRIETGTANLSTSTLYYGGLKYSAALAMELGHTEQAKMYTSRLSEMEGVIESYFGATLEGLDTYKYFDTNKYLRHWICLPLTMGITKRQEGTIQALFNKLWTKDGILVELNTDKTDDTNILFWDRATLYALRGAFKTNGLNIGYSKLKDFSKKRLLGDHVPYVIEAYPENNMRHLSAESALYCRIFTEGILGIEPVGFKEVKIKPQLPEDWDYLTLQDIYVSGVPVDIFLERKGERIALRIDRDGKTVLRRTLSVGKSATLSLK